MVNKKHWRQVVAGSQVVQLRELQDGLLRREAQGQTRLNWFRRLFLETEGQCFGNEVPKFVRNLR